MQRSFEIGDHVTHTYILT